MLVSEPGEFSYGLGATVLGRVMWTFREANTDNPDPYIQYLARRQVVPDRPVHY